MTTAERLAREYVDSNCYEPWFEDLTREQDKSLYDTLKKSFLAGYQAGVESLQLELRKARVEAEELRSQRDQQLFLHATSVSFNTNDRDRFANEIKIGLENKIESKKSEVV